MMYTHIEVEPEIIRARHKEERRHICFGRNRGQLVLLSEIHFFCTRLRTIQHVFERISFLLLREDFRSYVYVSTYFVLALVSTQLGF